MRRVVLFGVGFRCMVACGGGDDSEPAPSIAALMTEHCDETAALACAAPNEREQCLARLEVDRADAEQEGCTSRTAART
jgi:hypothetical protein